MIAVVLLGVFSTIIYAKDLNTKLKIVQKSAEQKELPDNQGYISKEIVDYDEDSGEAIIELKLSNATKEIETNADTEIFLVIDNSLSMEFTTQAGQSRKNILLNASKTLTNAIFNASSNVKVGVVKFNGTYGGLFGESAGLQNGKLVTAPTSDKSNVLSGLDSILNGSTLGGTNIDAGLQRAEKNFSANCQNKIIILLTDGIPNADVKGNNSGNEDVTNTTAQTVHSNTKETLQRLDNAGVSIISMIVGIALGDIDPSGDFSSDGLPGGPVYANQDEVDLEQEIVSRIFGTQSQPTVGKFYNVATIDAGNIIENDIFNDVLEKIQKPIKNIVIEDFFPTDILDNFTFEYVGNPSVGTVTNGIDDDTKSITWTIDTLKGDEVATLKYKLKIKDMKNEDLLNKTISTNEKVVLNYTDYNEEEQQVVLTSSPRIVLSEVEENSNEVDNTIAKGNIPQTGIKNVLIPVIAILIVIVVAILVRYRKYNDVK